MAKTMMQSAPLSRASESSSRILNKGYVYWILNNIVWLWLILVIVLFGVLNPFFLTISNFQNILVQCSILALLGMAVGCTLMVAEIDLSIAANMGFSSVIGALLIINGGMPWWLGVLIGILAATAIGFFNGLCITKLKMVSLIETLAMMIILQGALLAITQGHTITSMPDSYFWIGITRIFGWPIMPLVLLFILFCGAFFLRKTVPGRCIYSVGGNRNAAEAAGIRSDRIKILAFTLSGLLSGIAGYLLASWQMAITSSQGSSFLLYAIAAPILGGVSVFGGRGHVIGILGGALLLTVIRIGLTLVAIPSFYVGMIGGLIIFFAVVFDALRVRANSRS